MLRKVYLVPVATTPFPECPCFDSTHSLTFENKESGHSFCWNCFSDKVLYAPFLESAEFSTNKLLGIVQKLETHGLLELTATNRQSLFVFATKCCLFFEVDQFVYFRALFREVADKAAMHNTTFRLLFSFLDEVFASRGSFPALRPERLLFFLKESLWLAREMHTETDKHENEDSLRLLLVFLTKLPAHTFSSSTTNNVLGLVLRTAKRLLVGTTTTNFVDLAEALLDGKDLCPALSSLFFVPSEETLVLFTELLDALVSQVPVIYNGKEEEAATQSFLGATLTFLCKRVFPSTALLSPLFSALVHTLEQLIPIPAAHCLDEKNLKTLFQLIEQERRSEVLLSPLLGVLGQSELSDDLADLALSGLFRVYQSRTRAGTAFTLEPATNSAVVFVLTRAEQLPVDGRADKLVGLLFAVFKLRFSHFLPIPNTQRFTGFAEMLQLVLAVFVRSNNKQPALALLLEIFAVCVQPFPEEVLSVFSNFLSTLLAVCCFSSHKLASLLLEVLSVAARSSLVANRCSTELVLRTLSWLERFNTENTAETKLVATSKEVLKRTVGESRQCVDMLAFVLLLKFKQRKSVHSALGCSFSEVVEAKESVTDEPPLFFTRCLTNLEKERSRLALLQLYLLFRFDKYGWIDARKALGTNEAAANRALLALHKTFAEEPAATTVLQLHAKLLALFSVDNDGCVTNKVFRTVLVKSLMRPQLFLCSNARKTLAVFAHTTCAEEIVCNLTLVVLALAAFLSVHKQTPTALLKKEFVSLFVNNFGEEAAFAALCFLFRLAVGKKDTAKVPLLSRLLASTDLHKHSESADLRVLVEAVLAKTFRQVAGFGTSVESIFRTSVCRVRLTEDEAKELVRSAESETELSLVTTVLKRADMQPTCFLTTQLATIADRFAGSEEQLFEFFAELRTVTSNRSFIDGELQRLVGFVFNRKSLSLLYEISHEEELVESLRVLLE